MTLDEALSRIHRLNHDCFRIDGSRVVYFDPYQITTTKTADIICVSHDHFDHCSPEDIARVQGPKTVIVTEKSSAKKLSGDVRIVKPGDVVEVSGVTIEAHPAYNTDKQFHPKEAGMLSFVVVLDGIRFYHAGDSDFIPEMKDIRADIAFLPVSGTYVMTAEQAVEAARAMKPKVVIPMHYGAIVGTDDDAARFLKALEKEMRVVVLPKVSG